MKTLNEQIERLRELVRKCYGAVAGKNGTVPEVGERNMENLPAAIGSITHKEILPDYITFWDYKGDVMASYSKQELDKVVYPNVPDYSHLECRFYQWTHTLEQIKNTTHPLDVICRLESDLMHLYVDIPYDGFEFQISHQFGYNIANTIDWGDGSIEEYSSKRIGNSPIYYSFLQVPDDKIVCHVYNKGKYIIKLDQPAMFFIKDESDRCIYGLACGNFGSTGDSKTFMYPVYENGGRYGFGLFYIKWYIPPHGKNLTWDGDSALYITSNNLKIVDFGDNTLGEINNGNYIPNFSSVNVVFWENFPQLRRDTLLSNVPGRYIKVPRCMTNSIPNISNPKCREAVIEYPQDKIYTSFLYPTGGYYTGNEMVIPEGVLTLQNLFLNYVYYRTVVIPSTVTTINRGPWGYDNSKIDDIYIHIQDPSTCRLTYGDGMTFPTDRIHIPKGSLELYQNATNWSVYSDKYIDDIEL